MFCLFLDSQLILKNIFFKVFCKILFVAHFIRITLKSNWISKIVKWYIVIIQCRDVMHGWYGWSKIFNFEWECFDFEVQSIILLLERVSNLFVTRWLIYTEQDTLPVTYSWRPCICVCLTRTRYWNLALSPCCGEMTKWTATECGKVATICPWETNGLWA